MELAFNNYKPGAKWSGMQTNLVTALIESRVPYPEIARRCGISVGAVCGKANRLGIGKGCKEAQQARRTSTSVAPPDSINIQILEAQEQEAAQRQDFVLLEDLEDGHCQFVLGDPVHGKHCGRKQANGSVYCPEHKSRCTTTLEKRLAREHCGRQSILLSPAARTRLREAAYPRPVASPGFIYPVDTRTMEVIDSDEYASAA